MAVTALPLQQGLINLATGEIRSGTTIAHCEADGDITITWSDDSTVTYTMLAGDDRLTYDAKSVEIVSGTFTLARA